MSAAEYRDLVIAWKNGAPIRLRDIADVIDGAENVRLAAWANRAPAIILNIQRQPGANVIETVDRIKKILPQLQAALPGTVEVELLTDRTTTIRASVHDVQFELLLAVALVVMVIFVFLRNVPATLIPGCCRAAFAGRHLRRHVPGRFLDQQPDLDGADHRHRLRGRRRHRDDREHLRATSRPAILRCRRR